MPITVVGLGPGNPDQLTLEAQAVLRNAPVVHLRTERHPSVTYLQEVIAPSARFKSFDRLYDHAPTFEALYTQISDTLITAARSGEDVTYAVPGHPLIAERSVQTLIAEARTAAIPLRIVAGLSFVEPVMTAIGHDPIEAGLQIVDAHAPALEPGRPALVCQLYNRRVASEVKLALLDLYPANHQVILVDAAGVPGLERVVELPLHEIDHASAPIDHLTSLYLPALVPTENLRSFEGLVEIIAILRGPNGCPWDRKQTHESLKRYLIEEAYETLDALDHGDRAEIAEELGDLLLQIVLHAQIASEEGSFSIRDVIGSIAAKMIHRHPHVFGTATARTADEVVANWERLKQQERTEEQSILSGVPTALPALSAAETIQRRVARVGFDWPEIAGVYDKIAEEIEELRQASTPHERRDELGDLLFAIVNVARWLEVDAEEALRLSIRRFRSRFEQMETEAKRRGTPLETLSIDEQEQLWQEIKRREGAKS